MERDLHVIHCSSTRWTRSSKWPFLALGRQASLSSLSPCKTCKPSTWTVCRRLWWWRASALSMWIMSTAIHSKIWPGFNKIACLERNQKTVVFFSPCTYFFVLCSDQRIYCFHLCCSGNALENENSGHVVMNNLFFIFFYSIQQT